MIFHLKESRHYKTHMRTKIPKGLAKEFKAAVGRMVCVRYISPKKAEMKAANVKDCATILAGLHFLSPKKKLVFSRSFTDGT